MGYSPRKAMAMGKVGAERETFGVAQGPYGQGSGKADHTPLEDRKRMKDPHGPFKVRGPR